jgi:hypothetical protein
MFDFPKRLGWDTPVAPEFNESAFARMLRFFKSDKDCLERQHGRCPGSNLCYDCNWSEGTSLGKR